MLQSHPLSAPFWTRATSLASRVVALVQNGADKGCDWSTGKCRNLYDRANDWLLDQPKKKQKQIKFWRNIWQAMYSLWPFVYRSTLCTISYMYVVFFENVACHEIICFPHLNFSTGAVLLHMRQVFKTHWVGLISHTKPASKNEYRFSPDKAPISKMKCRRNAIW